MPRAKKQEPQKTDVFQDLISSKEASGVSGLSQRHIGHLARKGIIQARKLGHDWLIYMPSLKAYLDSNPQPGIKPGTHLWWRKKST